MSNLNLENLEDSVLYDLFYEVGSILGGSLLAKEREARQEGDLERYRKFHEERMAMRRERMSVKSNDRALQIECKRKWDARVKELRESR
ncbi:hypothetical protein [Bifidobacterium sp. SO4]|uniref:hypothetical protein n=1 Tax=Bifidobacterium sp. SO4 TaxID=2809030 RepID=UPI001BDCB3BC|nr:hypothetical protein [Bifidobacterium sp. SO4]MBT1171205.1 hypothetical protein [Bifidobacterium sp. SO4]